MWRILIYYDDIFGCETNITHGLYSSKAKANTEYGKIRNIKTYRFKESFPGMIACTREIEVNRVVLEKID